MLKTIKKSLLPLLLMLPFGLMSQFHSARISYERKTNLYKKFKDQRTQRWIKEEDRIKIDYFELLVTDSMALFKPQESELRESYAWATSKNTVLQDLHHHKRYLIKTIWGEELHLTDSLFTRKWKITESTRKIAGYTCRKALWQANDSTRIYAWFSYDLQPNFGPESFYGLPGTILGLATEDGGVVYFAKKVELVKIDAAQFTLPRKKKVYTIDELKAQMTKQYGEEKWFQQMINEQFGIW